MKTIIKRLLIAVISVIGGFLTYQTFKGYTEKKQTEARIQTLPDVAFSSLIEIPVNLLSFDQNRPLVLVYFHPECEHCQYEAQEIAQNAATFSNCQLVMITHDDSLQRVKNFCETYHLWEVDNIEVLIDTSNQFKTVFGKAVIPSVYIYGTNRKLKKQYLGETRIDLVLAEISAIISVH